MAQDLDFDAAVPLYVNRKYFIEFLHQRVFQQKHSNILEDFLYVTFSAVQYIAMARANALVDVLISRPLRWLSGVRSADACLPPTDHCLLCERMLCSFCSNR